MPQIVFNKIGFWDGQAAGVFFRNRQQIADFDRAAPHPRCRASTIEAFSLFPAYLCELRADFLKPWPARSPPDCEADSKIFGELEKLATFRKPLRSVSAMNVTNCDWFDGRPRFWSQIADRPVAAPSAMLLGRTRRQ